MNSLTVRHCYFPKEIHQSNNIFSTIVKIEFLLFCPQTKEVIMYPYCSVGLLDKGYYSAIMLPSNKAPWGLICKNGFWVGAYLRGTFSEIGTYWRIYGM